MFRSKRSRLTSVFAAVLVASTLLAAGAAEARMGGSFGSRGMRTYHPAPMTQTAPKPTAPIQNTMTKPGTPGATTAAPGAQYSQPRGGLWGGFGGGLLGGLLFSGLFGSLFGFGFGGLGGGLWMIVQILLLVWLVSFIVKRFRQRPAMAGGYGNAYEAPAQNYGQGGSGYGRAPASSGRSSGPDDIGVTNKDLATFEQMLNEVQAAYAREDHKALRRLATPEMVSYLSEELAENATRGVRNEVRDVRFLQGDVAEAWREGSREYATVAMRWSAIDILVDRQSGAVVKGDPSRPVEATELWTFVRDRSGDWTLCAIQEAGR